MPVIFVHGVNTRDGVDYRKDVVARNELLRRLLLTPLAAKGARFEQLEIVSPYIRVCISSLTSSGCLKPCRPVKFGK